MTAINPTFPAVLASALRTDPGRPFVTFYDHDSGERVELSVTTYANWVAKASGLLVDEHSLERGDTLRIDLPPHWLGLVFLGAAWNTGLAVTDATTADTVVCGPDTVADWAAAGTPTLACSLLPLGVRFADPLPAGAHDVGVEIWGQPDAFTPWDPPQPDDAALATATGTLTQGDLLAGAGSADRLLTTLDPTTPAGAEALTAPLLGHGSLVLVRHPDADRLPALVAAERVTRRLGDPDHDR